jgi:hypothetical protein
VFFPARRLNQVFIDEILLRVLEPLSAIVSIGSLDVFVSFRLASSCFAAQIRDLESLSSKA